MKSLNASLSLSRISTIFRVRSAQKVLLTDKVLVRRLLAITLSYIGYMVVWAVTQPPQLEVAKTLSGLKYQRCSITWHDAVINIGESNSARGHNPQMPAV